MKILVVDDEQSICEILQYNLETEGYQVDVANSAEEALGMDMGQYGLVLLDVMMGEMSGFEMAHRMKREARTANIPIIFITALDSEDSVVKGLNIGADDYMAKPLSLKEVKARVKAVLRRTSPETPKVQGETIAYETLQIDPQTKRATIEGEDLQLTRLELEILKLLIENKGKVYSREELLNRCWPEGVYVTDRTVDVNITRLRKKIGPYGNNIKTRVGYGYCFAE